MKVVFALALILVLLFGCTEEDSVKAPGENESSGFDVPVGPGCKLVAYETTRCSKTPYNFSYSPLGKLNQYMVGEHCIGGASITLKNLEKQGGIFSVTFVFETPIEGRVAKTVEHEIAPKSSAVFEEKVQFRCAQEYSVDFRIGAPERQLCRVVNETREECGAGPKAP